MKADFLRQGGLYAITSVSSACTVASVLEDVTSLLEGGCQLLQYRDKISSSARQQSLARQLLELCQQSNCTLLINDDWQLAARIGAPGVHLGQGDGNVGDARAALGSEAIIGVTCHDQLTLAQKAEQEGADYVAFGAFYPSRSKPEAKPAPLSLLSEARQLIHLPVVAIGGITLDRAPELWQAGADWVAVIQDLFAAENIGEKASAYATQHQLHRRISR
ncbi:thiamine phosphate synthase [Pokkaliibacter sp. CJK22405]|uniref:thiamine phosphate synthase n=1 Tax=Pokkaliibacter sp. CJK22405 TaxID=3384615 RepID=UPI003984FD4C